MLAEKSGRFQLIRFEVIGKLSALAQSHPVFQTQSFQLIRFEVIGKLDHENKTLTVDITGVLFPTNPI